MRAEIKRKTIANFSKTRVYRRTNSNKQNKHKTKGKKKQQRR